MEIFGGFMVMMSILGLFLAVVWLIMPFVVFAMKGTQDRSLEILESMSKRLTAIEEQLHSQATAPAQQGPSGTLQAGPDSPEPAGPDHPAVLPLA